MKMDRYVEDIFIRNLHRIAAKNKQKGAAI